MPRTSNKSKSTSRSYKKSSRDVNEGYKPPILSIEPGQLKFLHLAGPYYKQALDKGEGKEFVDAYFEDVYHPFYPVPHHEYFCMDAAQHGKSVLKEMVSKRLWWMRIFVSGVETVMDWQQFIALGKTPGEGWRTEIVRLRKALNDRTGSSSSLRFVPNNAESDIEREDSEKAELDVEHEDAEKVDSRT